MEDKASGEVFIDTYLLLDEVKLNTQDRGIINKRINLDTLISEFDVDSYSIPDLYELTTQRIENYISELEMQMYVIFGGIFETCNLSMLSPRHENDIVVVSSGRVYVKRQLIVHATGKNPKFQIDELNRKVEKDIYDYLDDNVAGISPEFTFATVVPAIE